MAVNPHEIVTFIVSHTVKHGQESAFSIQPPIVLLDLLINSVIMGLMVYVIMPHYTRLISKWLYA